MLRTRADQSKLFVDPGREEKLIIIQLRVFLCKLGTKEDIPWITANK